MKADGNFILGPTHNPAPEMTVQEGVPQGEIFNFTMESTDSKFYPGIARDTNNGRQARPGNSRQNADHQLTRPRIAAKSPSMSRSNMSPAR